MREGQRKPREVLESDREVLGNNPRTPENLKVPGRSREVPGKS
jgi:hypothetical protein